ncbi:hypothetical protein FA13DRAFT_1713829 [Coprinellus micaceus]|uniref:Uncharacterized protein n=1 Tax=Coprinellus micaceus TaxID=71717 RepID=A0A4Y7SVD4_COPMI|nr:hypothetical protein FA13DRAFT_1713829 [Coprinellus micaceus]
MSFDGKAIFPSNLVPVPDNHYVIDVPDLHDIIDVDKDLVSGTDDIMAGRIQGLDLMTKQSGPDGWIQTSMDESSSWRQSSGSMLDQDQAGGWTEPGWPRLDASRSREPSRRRQTARMPTCGRPVNKSSPRYPPRSTTKGLFLPKLLTISHPLNNFWLPSPPIFDATGAPQPPFFSSRARLRIGFGRRMLSIRVGDSLRHSPCKWRNTASPRAPRPVLLTSLISRNTIHHQRLSAHTPAQTLTTINHLHRRNEALLLLRRRLGEHFSK